MRRARTSASRSAGESIDCHSEAVFRIHLGTFDCWPAWNVNRFFVGLGGSDALFRHPRHVPVVPGRTFSLPSPGRWAAARGCFSGPRRIPSRPMRPLPACPLSARACSPASRKGCAGRDFAPYFSARGGAFHTNIMPSKRRNFRLSAIFFWPRRRRVPCVSMGSGFSSAGWRDGCGSTGTGERRDSSGFMPQCGLSFTHPTGAVSCFVEVFG
jgi:hypothetical protein